MQILGTAPCFSPILRSVAWIPNEIFKTFHIKVYKGLAAIKFAAERTMQGFLKGYCETISNWIIMWGYNEWLLFIKVAKLTCHAVGWC